MFDVTKNPPGGAYYLALTGELFGFSEVAMHAAMLVPALLCLAGVAKLAKGGALQAVVFTALAPAFLVSSTTLMCDVLMLCTWVWAMVFWERGLRDGAAR